MLASVSCAWPVSSSLREPGKTSRTMPKYIYDIYIYIYIYIYIHIYYMWMDGFMDGMNEGLE